MKTNLAETVARVRRMYMGEIIKRLWFEGMGIALLSHYLVNRNLIDDAQQESRLVKSDNSL